MKIVNVFTSSKCLRSKDCAVVVCIHGGDILYGSAVAFNDTYLLNSFVEKDVILVIPAFVLASSLIMLSRIKLFPQQIWRSMIFFNHWNM
ncbi:hypothetical protein L3Y34_003907 [Caenorhabditis briggsae]|uniref:Carboxylesterase type B domain-containing protein n=1 Tax=Caenorhabditis briggsae TaxID=6238 RepID=A0AAE9D4C7_CAEBR|nr:hypothetical protein L3Y34_003907 [Caenorhabditis briggsae]